MERTITVIKFNGGYIAHWEYSQGELSEVLTNDPLKAEDYSDPQKLKTVLQFYGEDFPRLTGKGIITLAAGVVEKYKLTIEKIQ